jgi:uncharacterized damage-inducible protein DinB
MRLLTAAFLFTAVLSAQDTPANPLVSTSKAMYAIAKNDVLGSVKAIPDQLWSFQPNKDVRTIAQLFAHIADGQYEFCGVAAEGQPAMKGVEKSATTKDAIVAALNDAFAYCDATYAKMTDANAADLAQFFGMKVTKLGAMDFNIAHTMEHYGNLVTYMRLNNIVPPSSAPRPPQQKKKQ